MASKIKVGDRIALEATITRIDKMRRRSLSRSATMTPLTIRQDNPAILSVTPGKALKAPKAPKVSAGRVPDVW